MSVSPGQPFTFTTEVKLPPGVTITNGVCSPPFQEIGSVFTLTDVGQYAVRYRMDFSGNGNIIMFTGDTMQNMQPLSCTLMKKIPQFTKISGTAIITTKTPSSFLAICIEPGNTNPITNKNEPEISIQKLR